jgi:DNA polymerase III subunit delta'
MASFSGVIGHEVAQSVLFRMIENKTLPHAMLFVGPESVGKTTLAHALIREVLDFEGDLLMHPDVHVLERLTDEKTGKEKTQISVKQVRELTQRVSLSSMMGGYKVVLIKDAQFLSTGAANALLKTLEEPKGKMLFLLRATSSDQLPATIVSRCQVLRLNGVSKECMIEGVVKMGFTKPDARMAADRALGRPGRALSFLKDSEYRSQSDTGIAQAIEFLSGGVADRLGQVMELIPKSEVHKTRRLLVLLDQWELVFRDILFEQIGCRESRVLARVSELDKLVQSISTETLLTVLDRIAHVRRSTKFHINPHLALEHISLS